MFLHTSLVKNIERYAKSALKRPYKLLLFRLKFQSCFIVSRVILFPPVSPANSFVFPVSLASLVSPVNCISCPVCLEALATSRSLEI